MREVSEQKYGLQVELDRLSAQNEDKIRGLELVLAETKKENDSLLVQVARIAKSEKGLEEYYS